MKRLLRSAIAIAFLGTLALPAIAATLKGGEDLSISSVILGNAYVAGSRVTTDASVSGDLSVAGGDITLNKPISGDVLAAGGNISLFNPVGGSLRAAGGKVQIRASVDGDLALMAGSIDVSQGSTIGGDLLVAGGEVTVGGTIEGNVFVRSGNVKFLPGSIVKGDVDMRGESIVLGGSIDGNAILAANSIKFQDQAVIMKNVRYWQRDNRTPLPSSQVRGTLTRDETLATMDIKVDEKAAAGILGALFIGLQGYLTLSAAFVILILLLLTKTFFTDTAKFLVKHPWSSFFYGFLYFAATPIAILLFFVTVIGIPLAFVITVTYVFSFVFLKPLTAITLARTFEVSRKKQWGMLPVFLLSVVIFILLKFIGFIPVIGWMAVTAAAFFAFGALIETKWSKWMKIR